MGSIGDRLILSSSIPITFSPCGFEGEPLNALAWVLISLGLVGGQVPFLPFSLSAHLLGMESPFTGWPIPRGAGHVCCQPLALPWPLFAG